MKKNMEKRFSNSTGILKIPALTLFSIILVLVIAINIVGCTQAAPIFRGSETGEMAEEEAYMLEEKMALTNDSALSKRGEPGETAVAVEGEHAFNPQDATLERKMIYRGYMELEVEEGKFGEKFEQIGKIAQAVGGFVSNTDSSAYGDQLAMGTITIRIPVESFDSVIEQIKKLGNVKNLNTNVQEVTQEYVDLNSRLKHFKAQEEILLEMMKESETVTDSIEVQRELSRVQEQIETIKGRLRFLDEQISLSTITVFVTEPYVKPQAAPIRWEFLNTLREGLRAFINVINGLVIFIMAIFPIAVIAAIGFLIVRYILKRRKSKKKI